MSSDVEFDVEAIYCTYRNKDTAAGTLHVFLPAAMIDIRGIQWRRVAEKVFIKFPHFDAIDDTGEYQKFPLICFIDDEKVKAFRERCEASIREELPKLKSRHKTARDYFRALHAARKKRRNSKKR